MSFDQAVFTLTVICELKRPCVCVNCDFRSGLIILYAEFSPELCVLRVHHCRAFCEDFSDADSTDLLFNSPRHLLNLRNNDFLQNHAKHSVTKNVNTVSTALELNP